MQPHLVAWFERHGLPGWMAPDYIWMAAVGSIVAAAVALALAPVERRATHARALAWAYAVAYPGGYVFEVVRLLPGRLLAGEWGELLSAGRAAFGGLLAAMAAAVWVLRRERAPLGPFFDCAAVGTGIVFGFVRVGCFIAGCDFGVTTAGVFGVRFPAGSYAAMQHATLGFIAPSSMSLPVHPTQLYEAAFGLVSALGCWLALRRLPIAQRRGQVFLGWLAAYSVFRFNNEWLRGDVDRGVYAGLGSSQLVSLLVLIAVVAWYKLGHGPLSSHRRGGVHRVEGV